MIQIHQLKKKFDEKLIFDGFSYIFPQTGIVGVCGESGKGKTTLLRMIAGLDKIYEGKIQIKDNQKIAFVFQEDCLLPTCSVLENVKIVLKNTINAEKKAKECLTRVGLKDELQTLPNALSKGMRQRVNIARALAYDADIILMDEPFSHLDEKRSYEILDFIITESKHKLFVVVTHNSNYLSYMNCECICL